MLILDERTSQKAALESKVADLTSRLADSETQRLKVRALWPASPRHALTLPPSLPRVPAYGTDANVERRNIAMVSSSPPTHIHTPSPPPLHVARLTILRRLSRRYFVPMPPVRRTANLFPPLLAPQLAPCPCTRAREAGLQRCMQHSMCMRCMQHSMYMVTVTCVGARLLPPHCPSFFITNESA